MALAPIPHYGDGLAFEGIGIHVTLIENGGHGFS
jgi:hypothetical protein